MVNVRQKRAQQTRRGLEEILRQARATEEVLRRQQHFAVRLAELRADVQQSTDGPMDDTVEHLRLERKARG